MKADEIISRLQQEFPGKRIITLPRDDPLEVICEVEPASHHPQRSIVVAIIDMSEPHYHLKSTETYLIEEGLLTLYIEGQKHILIKGQFYTVQPNYVHWAEGKLTRTRVTSSPGWTLQDHISILR